MFKPIHKNGNPEILLSYIGIPISLVIYNILLTIIEEQPIPMMGVGVVLVAVAVW